MIPIQLETGKTVFKTFEEWIDMTPEKYQDMIANDEGIELNNPFDGVLDRIKENRNSWDIPDLPNIDEVEVNEDLKDISDGKDKPGGK